MKKIFILICILFVSFIQSQELKTNILLAPESNKHSDLQFLKSELQGKKMVMLGEITHMYGNIFEMKARIVEYLHQELGYTTIAMESSMYDLWLLHKKGFNSKDFNRSIWGVWANTLEFQRLVNYIDENKLKVIGFDSQVQNTSQFVEDFYSYCNTQNISFKLNKDDVGIIIEGVLENVTIEEDDIEYTVYEKELKRIILEIEKLSNTETNYYWKQFLKSLLACSQDAYYNRTEIYSTDFGNKNHNIRDQQMADNLLSYVNRNPNEKIICWADNIHIINNHTSIKKPIEKDFISMGTYVKKELKDAVYSLATLHANDSLYDPGAKKWYPTPIKNNSFEQVLSSLNKPYLFVTSNQVAMQNVKETRLLNYIDFTGARLDQLHDGYIFFQKATLPKLTLKKHNTKSEKIQLNEKINQNVTKQKVTLKGQILDTETNLPISYANVILKKEEIYRVADENGNFELTIPYKLISTATVNISAMGFENRSIPLINLTAKIKLSPKFELLNEIILTGHLSPKTVLEKAINAIEKNHPLAAFNCKRYSDININKNDETLLKLELITKDYDQGYQSPFIITQRVEQIKWNKNSTKDKYKYSSQFFLGRQNAIQYSNILHKRKHKKFNLKFIKSFDPNDDAYYIISFNTNRNKWNYTNRGYPTKYTGKIYIHRDNFSIAKVIENWETTLNKTEIEKYFKGIQKYANKKVLKIKEENSCTYSKTINGKLYASNYFYRSYKEAINTDDLLENSVFEVNSKLYDFDNENVEEIEYEFRNKKETVLNRVAYDKEFWNSFYEEHSGLLKE